MASEVRLTESSQGTMGCMCRNLFGVKIVAHDRCKTSVFGFNTCPSMMPLLSPACHYGVHISVTIRWRPKMGILSLQCDRHKTREHVFPFNLTSKEGHETLATLLKSRFHQRQS